MDYSKLNFIEIVSANSVEEFQRKLDGLIELGCYVLKGEPSYPSAISTQFFQMLELSAKEAENKREFKKGYDYYPTEILFYDRWSHPAQEGHKKARMENGDWPNYRHNRR